MNPEDNFDEIFPTDIDGIYEYYDEVLIDYKKFKLYENQLFKAQINNQSFYFPFVGFWSDSHESVISDLTDEYLSEFQRAQMQYVNTLTTQGYKKVMENFLELYPQFSDIFVGLVED